MKTEKSRSPPPRRASKEPLPCWSRTTTGRSFSRGRGRSAGKGRISTGTKTGGTLGWIAGKNLMFLFVNIIKISLISLMDSLIFLKILKIWDFMYRCIKLVVIKLSKKCLKFLNLKESSRSILLILKQFVLFLH